MGTSISDQFWVTDNECFGLYRHELYRWYSPLDCGAYPHVTEVFFHGMGIGNADNAVDAQRVVERYGAKMKAMLTEDVPPLEPLEEEFWVEDPALKGMALVHEDYVWDYVQGEISLMCGETPKFVAVCNDQTDARVLIETHKAERATARDLFWTQYAPEVYAYKEYRLCRDRAGNWGVRRFREALYFVSESVLVAEIAKELSLPEILRSARVLALRDLKERVTAPPTDSTDPLAAQLIALPAKDGYIDIVFTDRSDQGTHEFVEVENELGAGINFGEWVDREDGFCALRIRTSDILKNLVEEKR